MDFVHVGIMIICEPTNIGRQVIMGDAKFHAIIQLMT